MVKVAKLYYSSTLDFSNAVFYTTYPLNITVIDTDDTDEWNLLTILSDKSGATIGQRQTLVNTLGVITSEGAALLSNGLMGDNAQRMINFTPNDTNDNISRAAIYFTDLLVNTSLIDIIQSGYLMLTTDIASVYATQQIGSPTTYDWYNKADNTQAATGYGDHIIPIACAAVYQNSGYAMVRPGIALRRNGTIYAYAFLSTSPIGVTGFGLKLDGISDSNGYITESNAPELWAMLENAATFDDPYEQGGNSQPSTPAGTFTNTGTDVGAPALPTMDPSASGFMKAYNPSGAQMQSFAQWLWNTFDPTTLQQIYTNPMEAVIGLLAVPVSPTVGEAQTINLGNVTTSVSAPVITNRFKKLDFGEVTIPEWWGAYLDYEPYTQVSIFLPYIGVQQLDTNDVMGKSVHVYYYVDVLSGACLAVLECAGKALYHFPGQCGVQIPVTASSFGNVLQSALSVASSALQSIASQASGNFQSVSEVATSIFAGSKTRTQRSGQVGSAAGFMDNQLPFFIVQRPVQCKPESQNQFTGYPAFITYTLSDLIGKGYTEVEAVWLTNVPALADELTELEAVLKSGVIL